MYSNNNAVPYIQHKLLLISIKQDVEIVMEIKNYL